MRHRTKRFNNIKYRLFKRNIESANNYFIVTAEQINANIPFDSCRTTVPCQLNIYLGKLPLIRLSSSNRIALEAKPSLRGIFLRPFRLCKGETNYPPVRCSKQIDLKSRCRPLE
jgi:hypothetical protein